MTMTPIEDHDLASHFLFHPGAQLARGLHDRFDNMTYSDSHWEVFKDSVALGYSVSSQISLSYIQSTKYIKKHPYLSPPSHPQSTLACLPPPTIGTSKATISPVTVPLATLQAMTMPVALVRKTIFPSRKTKLLSRIPSIPIMLIPTRRCACRLSKPQRVRADPRTARDENNTIDSSNIMDSRTRRAAKKAGTYAEPGGEEGLPGAEDGTSAICE